VGLGPNTAFAFGGLFCPLCRTCSAQYDIFAWILIRYISALEELGSIFKF
jgi:hypothetical protein